MLLNHFLLVDQKSVFHQSLRYNILFLYLEYSIFYYLLSNHYYYHVQMVIQKVYLHLESLAQLNNLSFDLLLIILVLLDIYSNLFFLKPDFNCGNNFSLS